MRASRLQLYAARIARRLWPGLLAPPAKGCERRNPLRVLPYRLVRQVG